MTEAPPHELTYRTLCVMTISDREVDIVERAGEVFLKLVEEYGRALGHWTFRPCWHEHTKVLGPAVAVSFTVDERALVVER